MSLQLRAVITVLTVSLSTYLFAGGMPTLLSVQPDRCIALHQGQVCYQAVKLNWHTPPQGEYCLFEQGRPNPLLCWHGDKKNTYTQEFKSKQGVTYEIRAKNDREKLTEARVKVAWVYKSSRKSTSSWRLF